jgi:hypothetical protein
VSKKVVIVDWDDAFIETDDFSAKDAEKTKPCRRRTVGFLITKNQHGYVLATDEYAKKADGYAARLFIPLGIVTKVQALT